MVENINDLGISDGALELLRIARENDTRRALSRNAALLTVLEFGQRLVHMCREGDLTSIHKLVGSDKSPDNFLSVVAAILRTIQIDLDRQYHEKGDRLRIPVASDFNHHVLQGFAQALADIAWPERNADDFDGPSIKTCIKHLASVDPRGVWTLTIQNYLGNILQYYFSESRIREQVQGLDLSTEVNLRSIDASRIAQRVMVLAPEITEVESEPVRVMYALHLTLEKITT